MSANVRIESRLGRVVVRWDEDGRLVSVLLGAHSNGTKKRGRVIGKAPHEDARRLVSQIAAFLDGEREALCVSVADANGTQFQRAVWEATCRIPYGETRSYGWVAETIGKPGAARAVGGALSKNPLHILVPCHRVVSSSGSLTGFAAGMDWKESLLKMEEAGDQGMLF